MANEKTSSPRHDPPTQSPCVSICKLDPKGQFCIGCGRTLAQIAAAGAGR